MAGLDLPSKLRNGLGQGKVVPKEVLARRMIPFDRDKDGALTRTELADFLKANAVGGRWFCDMLAKMLWKYCSDAAAMQVEWIKLDGLAGVLNYVMSRDPRPAKRIRITPEAAQGYEPLEFLDPKLNKGSAAPQVPGNQARPGQQQPLGQRAPSSLGAPRASAGPGPRPRAAPRAGPAQPQSAQPRQPTRPGPRPPAGRPGPRR